jgi:hypothetical protein
MKWRQETTVDGARAGQSVETACPGAGTQLADTWLIMGNRVAAVALVAILTSSSGCLVSPRAVHQVGYVASAALWTAAVIGTVAVLSYHDPHYHHDHCGHYRRWHGDRWIYYYGDHWEYYDEPTASWYFYAEA